MLRGARDASGLARVPIDLDVLGEEDGRGVPAGTSVGHRSDQRRGFGNAILNDPDGDSDDDALDLEQKRAVDDDLNAITADLRKQLRDKKKRGAGYVNLFQYLFFCMFYFVVVFMQADVYNAYSVVSSVRRAVVPLDGDGYPVSAMANPTEILDWLVDTAFPVWTDEICGDGVCNEPFEFPAYGRFGCRSDCGSNTNLTTMLLQVRADFRDDLYAPRALMSAASWNLCKRDEAAKKAGFPDVCWWEDDRMFNKIVENHLETVNVPPDELWFVSVKGDYMGRVVGNIFIAENNSLPWVGTVPEWKACARNVVSSRREVATNNARRMLLDVEKHEAATWGGAEAGARKARGARESFDAVKNRVLSHKRHAVPGETVETLVKADGSSGKRKLQVGPARDAAESAFDWMDQKVDDFVDFWNSRESVPAPAPASPVLLKASPTKAMARPATLTPKAVGRPERRALLGDQPGGYADSTPSAFYFENNETYIVVAEVDSSRPPLMPEDGSMTFEAWIKPNMSEGGDGEVLAMMGIGGWTLSMSCDANGTTGCCSDAAAKALAFHIGDNSTKNSSGWYPSCSATSDTGVERGEWSHVAVRVYAVGNFLAVDFFIDGDNAGTTTNIYGSLNIGNLPSDGYSPTLMLGRTNYCDERADGYTPERGCFKYFGYMDGVRLWNTNLTDDAIASRSSELAFPFHPNVDDLLFEYTFDNAPAGAVALDGSLNMRHATVQMCNGVCDPRDTRSSAENVVFDKSTFSKNDRALVFKGDTRYEIGGPDAATAFAPLAALTFDAWVYPEGTSDGGEMLASYGADFEGWGVMLMCKTPGMPGCCASGSHVDGSIGFFAGGANCLDFASSNAAVPRSVWSHVVVTATPGEGAFGNETLVAFYINGVSSGHTPTSFDIDVAVNAPKLGLGGVAGCTDETCVSFHGLMDTVRVSNTSLSASFVPVAMDGPTHFTFSFATDVLAEFTFDAGPMSSLGELAVVGIPDHEYEAVFSSENAKDFGDAAPFSASLFLNASAPGWVRTAGGAAEGLNPDFFTFEAWINPDANTSPTSTIAMLGDFGWGLVLTCYGPEDWCCDVNITDWDAVPRKHVLAFATDTTCDLFPRSNVTVVLDTWTHVAVTVDSVNQEVAFYVDGKPAGGGSGENAAAGDGGGGPLVFGTNFECVNSSALVSNSTVCAAFTGHIDNIRMWSKPLKAWEVEIYYDRHLHAADPTMEFLVSNYSFDATFADTHARVHDLLGFEEFPFDMTNSKSLEDALFEVAEPAALRFAADTTATVPLTDVTEFAPESLTFEAWIKPDEDSAHFGGFLASLGHAGWRVAMMCNANATSPLDKVGCCIDGAHVEHSIGFFGNDDDPCTAAASSTIAVVKGKWTHVAVVVTQPGGGFKNAPRSVEYSVCFVINGESAGCSTKSTHGVSSGLPADANVTALRESDALGVLSGHFQLGGYKGKSGSCGNDDACSLMAFRGLMDNVRVWSAPLDHATVASYKQAEIDHDHPYLSTLIANYSLSVGKFHGLINEGAISDSRAGVWDVYDGTVVNGAYDRNEDVTLASQPVIVPAPEGASAFYFNGFDQYVETPYNASLAPSDVLTVEVWIKPVGPDFVMQPIVGLGDLGWGVHLMCAGGEFANATDWRGCCGNHVNGALGFLSSLDHLTGEECAAVPSSTVGVTYGRWNLVAVTVDVTRRTAEFFIDGKFVNEAASWDVTLTDGGAKPLLLGGCPRDPHGGCQALFMGYMDDLRVWHAVVDEAHVNGFSNRTLTGAAHPNADDLLLYYRFDASAGSGNGTVWDLGPYELHGVAMSADIDNEVYFNSSIGTLPGAPAPPPFLQGPESSSLYFNGADTHVTFDDSNTLAALSDVTFEAWIKPAGEVRAETIVMYGNYGWGVLLMCNPEDGAKRGCCGTHKSGALGFWTATSRTDNTACASTPSSTEAVTRGQWNHVAVAARRGLVEFYINGAFAGAVAGEHVRVKGGTGSSQLVLGGLGASCPTCLPYGGYMDEIRLFGGMLPGHEIAAWKDFAMSPKHPSSKTLLAHFTFDATSGTVMNRAAPAIGFAAEVDHVPTVVQDIAGGTEFGKNVVIDGDTMVIMQDWSGKRWYVYARNTPGLATSKWNLVDTINGTDADKKCIGSDGSDGSRGWYVDGLALHGDVLVVVCPNAHQTNTSDSLGYGALILTRNTPGNLTSTWSLSHGVTLPDPADNTVRVEVHKVAVHGDTVVLSRAAQSTSEGNRNSGYTYVFARDAQNTWTRVQDLRAPDDNLYFGSSVAIDGDQLAVGAQGEDEGNGAVYVFARDTLGYANSTWTQTARISPDPDTESPDTKNAAVEGVDVKSSDFKKRFGWTVDLQDDLLVVAAPGAIRWGYLVDHSEYPDGGAVFVYKRLDADLSSAWECETEIYAPKRGNIDERDVDSFGEFAYHVSYRNEVLAVGAWSMGNMEVYTRTTSFAGGLEWSHIPYDFYTNTGTDTRGVKKENCGRVVATDGAVVIMGCGNYTTISVFSLTPDFGPGVVSSSSHEYALWNSGEHVTLAEASLSSATETTTSPRVGPTSMYFNGADTKITTRCGSNDAHARSCGGATSATGYSSLKPDDYLTFTAWIKPDDVVAGQMIAMLGEWGWGVLLMCPGGAGKGCCGDHITNAIGFWSDNNVTTSSCAETLSSDVGVTRGQWSHIAVVVDASHYTNEVIFYVNGAIAGRRRSDTRGEILSPLGGMDRASFVVGQGPCPNGCLDYKGHIDELSVYVALWSESEIGSWYDKPATAGNASTRASPHFARGVLGYSFDDARGDDVLNMFPHPDGKIFGGYRFDGQITSRDAGYVVWDVSDRATLSPAIGFPSCPFKCNVGGFVAAACPCDHPRCDVAPLMDFHKNSIECVEVMIEYCVNDNGWYYEPEPCWAVRTREIEIQRVGPTGATLFDNTPLLGDRNVIVEIGDGALEEDVVVMVTEISYKELQRSIGEDALPEKYAEAKSDYILLRSVNNTINATGGDKITLRIPFDATLALGDNEKGFNPWSYQLAFLDETHGFTALDWVPVDAGHLTYYARDALPEAWNVSLSNTTTRYGGDRIRQADLPKKECRSFEFNYECPDASAAGINPSWEDVFNNRSGELDQTWYDSEDAAPKHALVYYVEATVSEFGVYAVMELGYSPPPPSPPHSPLSPPPPYIAPSPPSPPPPSPPPWPDVAEGSTEYVFALEFAVSLETLNSQSVSKRRRLLDAKTQTGLGRRLMNVVFGSKPSSDVEASDASAPVNAGGRKLLEDTSPAFVFLLALRDAFAEETGLSTNNVRLGAVTSTASGGISVEFSLVFASGDTTDLLVLTDSILADPGAIVSEKLQAAGFDATIYNAPIEPTSSPKATVLLPPPPASPPPPPPLVVVLVAPPPPSPPPAPVFKIVAPSPPPSPPPAPPPFPPPFVALAPKPPPPSPPSPPEVTPPVIRLVLDDSCVQTSPAVVTCTQVQTVLSNIYTDPGFSASDNLEGSYPLTAVTVRGFGEKDENGLGRIDLTLERSENPWRITYNIADAVGNAASQMTRLIYVIPPCEPSPECPTRKLCKELSTATEVVCQTCSAGADPICLVEQEVKEVADLRPPVVTSVKSITMSPGADPAYSFKAQDEETREDIIVAYVEQGRQFTDPGATARETITSTDQKTGVSTVSVSDITSEITTGIAGVANAQKLNPGDFFRYVYEILESNSVDAAPLVQRTRTVVVLNPCTTTTTPFGDILGTKAMPQYDLNGETMDEFLCNDEDWFDRYGELIYLPTGQCSTNGRCLGIELEEEEVVVTFINDPPEVKLFGLSVVEITAGLPWLICLPGQPSTDVCDRGVDEFNSFDPIAVPDTEYEPANRRVSKVTNKIIRVCANPDGLTGGAVFAESHSTYGNRDLAAVCGFTTKVAGTFTIEYSFVDDAGQQSRVSRQIIVKPDCGKTVNPNNGLPEFLCDNKELNDQGLLDYVCSVNNYCAGDLTDDVVELVDVFPTLNVNVVPGVIEKTVNIRKYQPYAPCKVNPDTGVTQQPEVTFFGDGLCDPGVSAFDVKQTRTTTGEILEATVDLTRKVLSCPPVECENLESCDDHKYTKKGLGGCIDTSIEGPTTIEFTVRDDSSQVTKVLRQITVIGPCPTGYEYCPGVGDRDCQTTEVCDNAVALAAATAASSPVEVIDNDAPEFTRYLPAGPILLEYGVNYLTEGNSPLSPCLDTDDATEAFRLYNANANATQLPCALTAYDVGDGEDVTRFVSVTQVIFGDETNFNLAQHGTGVIPPAQYVYQYTVTDLEDNKATETLVINVALRKFYQWDDITVDTSVWNLTNFKTKFLEKQAEELGDVFLEYFPNYVFRGAEDLEILSSTNNATADTTSFAYKLTYFEIPEGYVADPVIADESRKRASARRSLLASSDPIGDSLSSSLTNSSGQNITSNATSEEGTESPEVNLDAAVLASIQGEISVISAKLDTATTGLQETVDFLDVAGGNPASYKQRVGDYWKTLLEIGDQQIKALQTQAEETLQVLDATIAVQQAVLESVAELEILLKQQADAVKATIDALGVGNGDSLGASCEFRTPLGGAEIFFNTTKYSQFGSPPPNPAPPPSPPAPPPTPPSPPPATRRLLEDTHGEDDFFASADSSPTGISFFASDGVLAMTAKYIFAQSEGIVVDVGDGTEPSSARRRSLLQSLSGAGWSGASAAVSDWNGYGILQGGVTAQYKAPSSYIGRRYVGNTNRLIGGLLIHQTRNELVECENKRFANISASCRAMDFSKKSFGVDPVFRRPQSGQGGLDSLYNVELEDFVADYYNTSQSAGKMRAVDTTADSDAVGTPYGFVYREVPGYPDGFPVFLDIAATRNNLGNMLQYLKEGLYFDQMTRSVTAQGVTYNSNLKQLANVVVMFNFTDAGAIDVSHKVTNMNVKWYTEFNDANGDGVNDGAVQLGCEIVLALMFSFAAALELGELLGAIWDESSVIRGIFLHFSNFWNVVDAANIGLQLMSVSVWISYQALRRQKLAPLLRYNVYDNPSQPTANYLMPYKAAASQTEAEALVAEVAAAGITDEIVVGGDTEKRWTLPTDESGIERLGEQMVVILELSDILTSYFFISGVSLLLMTLRSLKMVDFQRHLDLTTRTLSRSGLDLAHFLIIFFISLFLSTMTGHVMLGSSEENLSSFDKGFNFHFEMMLGSSLDVLARLFADKSVVRGDIEYATLVVYSFFIPAYLLFVLLNLILGIVGDAFGEEKENLAELDEPTLLDDLNMAISYRFGRILGTHPSFNQLIRTLKAVRVSKVPKSVDVLASALGGKGGHKGQAVVESVDIEIAGTVIRNTPAQSQGARARWALIRQQAVKTNVLKKAMGVNLNELRVKDNAEQMQIARETGGVGLLVDVLKTAEDVDSDSDSSVDEEVKARKHKQHVIRGTAKPTAWSAIKEHMVAPKVNSGNTPAGAALQTLMDDTWSEFMVGIKTRQRNKAEARMFRIKKALYTEAEVTEWLLDAEMEAKRDGYFGNKPPSKRVIKRIIDSVCEHKVQQFGAQDSDEEEEQEEMDEIIEAVRDIKAAAVGKMQRFVRREIGWQTQTLVWQKAVTEATIKMEEELVMTYQVITDLQKRGGDSSAIADPQMRERMWATIQAKQALRAALQNTPDAAAEPELDESSEGEMDGSDDSASSSDEEEKSSPQKLVAGSKQGSLNDRWKASSEIEGGSSGSVAGSAAVGTEGKKSHAKVGPSDPNARTATTSSMRRHRAGKKAKEAKAAKMAAFNE